MLQDKYVGLGGMICAVDPYAGLVIVKSAEARSMEVVRAARHNKRMWDLLERFVSGGDSFACLFGHGFMVLALLIHSGRIRSNPRLAILLKMSGYAEEDVLAPPVGMQNGYTEFAGNHEP